MARTHVEEPPESFKYLSLAYTALFTIEIILRLIAFPNFFCSEERLWNAMDFVIALSSIADVMLEYMPALMTLSGEADTRNLSFMRMVRIVRAVRVLRVIRIMRFFRSLRLLLVAVWNTLRSLCWTTLLLVMIQYMFGVIFTQVSNTEGTGTSEAREYYGTVLRSIYTLFQSISGGIDWHRAADALAGMGPIWLLLFIMYVSFTYFAVLNV